ncbi:MAG TPA: DUF4382 domain-containing protein [Holophagaceae bacterium]|jgi:hypothetical protein|nr:DUF4382 domain-containing protein [Holophagaceae bacterium]
MAMRSRLSTALLPAGASLLSLLVACGGGSSSSSAPQNGQVALGVTDAPSDAWQSVSVQITKLTLFNSQQPSSEVTVFQGGTDPSTNPAINLVDLDGLAQILGTASVPAGTYDRMRVSINPDPASMSLVDENGNTIPAASIKVVGGTGITVRMDNSITVTPGATSFANADFDLSDPMSIVITPAGAVVLDFQVKCHNRPGNLWHLIHLHHNAGIVDSVSASGFAMTTRHGANLSFAVDNGTWFWNADAKAPGQFADLAQGKAVMVSGRLDDSGMLHAVRVWYANSITTLPLWSPEGHVYGVDTTNNDLVVSNADGHPRTVDVDANTVFTYHQSTALGTGLAALSTVQRGFKVSITVADPLATPLLATSVNVERAADYGQIDASSSASALVYDHPWAPSWAQASYSYGSPFSWWFFAQPMNTSADVNAFASVLAGAQGVRVNGFSELGRDSGNTQWLADTAVVVPAALPAAPTWATISSSFTPTATGGSLAITYTDPVTTLSATRTITLSSAASSQTLVAKIVNQGGVITSQLDGPANWAADLTTSAHAVRVSVVPQADGTLAAYGVVVVE